MLKTLFILFALTSSPTPAPNYCSYVSPAVAEEIMYSTEYQEYLDFNGDGELNTADAVQVSKRYNDNITYGNTITVDSEVIESMINENYSDECIYWEIDFIKDDFCREYEMTVNEITTFHVYVEFEDYCTGFNAETNPFEEKIIIKAD